MKYDAVIRELTYAIREVMAAWKDEAERGSLAGDFAPSASPSIPIPDEAMKDRVGMLLKLELGHLKIAKGRALDAGQALARGEIDLGIAARLGGVLRELSDVEEIAESERYGEPAPPERVDLTERLRSSLRVELESREREEKEAEERLDDREDL